jgi:choline monooxygenase
MTLQPLRLTDSELAPSPVETAFTLPSTLYTHPEAISLERERIFRKQWQLAGHVSQLDANGGALRLEIAGNPLIIVRDGELIRGFHDVCKHRGGPLCIKKGTRSVIQCEYHGWTYRMDGSLRGVPQFDRVDLFEKRDFGLEPIAVEVWNGLILVHLDPSADSAVPMIDAIASRISPIDIASMRFHSSASYDIACDWKVYIDNFLEGYHIPIVHPDLARLLDYSRYVTECDDLYSLQFSPFADAGPDNPYHAEDGRAFYYFIYPNFMLNILPNRMQLNRVDPAGTGRCVVHFDYFYTDPEQAEASGMAADDRRYSEQIQQEDIEICEAVQRRLGSDAYHRGRFSVRREEGVWHFQEKVKASLRSTSGD